MAQNIIKIVFSVFTAKPQPSTLVYAVSLISHRRNLEVFKMIFSKNDHVIIPRIYTYISLTPFFWFKFSAFEDAQDGPLFGSVAVQGL